MDSPTPLIGNDTEAQIPPQTPPKPPQVNQKPMKSILKKPQDMMVVGCGNKCVKYFFWLLNFLFFALGALIIAVGLWVIFDPNWQYRLQSVLNVQIQGFNFNNFTIIIWVIIAFGVILFILGGLGCGGSCCESLCVIGVYFVLVALLFALEIAGGVYFYLSKDNIRNTLAQVWRTELVNNYNSNPTIQQSLDNIQRQMGCCGAYGCSDFNGSPPQSCQGCFQQNNYAVPGCANQLFDTFTQNLTIVLIAAIVILIVEFIALVFACCTCCAVKSKRNSI